MGNKPILQSNKLVVGQLDLAHIPATPAVPGTTVLNGPVWIGGAPPAIPIANCMIWPGVNPITLDVAGISNISGVTNHSGVFNVFGTVNRSAVTNSTGAITRTGLSITNATSIKNGLNEGTAKNVFNFVTVTANIKSPVYKGGTYTGTLFKGTVCQMNKFIGNIRATTGVNPDIAARIQTVRAIAQSKKGFDIPHPSKEGHRLRYTTLEGPGVDVYYRGSLKDSNVIELPSYWKDLVNPETIQVHLTPFASYQELFVEKIEWGQRIIVKNNAGGPINCSYIVYAERSDGEKLIPEYKGLTPMDYPGDNSEYNINSF